MTAPRRDWFSVGADHDRAAVEAAILDLRWRALPCDMPAMPGLGVKEAIRQLRMPNVSHVAHGHGGPELVGLKNHGFVTR